MMQVVVRYHHEDEAWWAESADIEGFVAAGDSLAQVRTLVHEGVPFYLDRNDVDIFEELETSWGPAPAVSLNVVGAFVATTSHSGPIERTFVSSLPDSRAAARVA